MPPGDGPPAGTSRPMPRWLLLAAAMLLVARVATGVWEARHAPETPAALGTPDRVGWVEPSRAEFEARRTGKPILYEFGADWCGPCQQLAREVFADATAAERIESWFVPVHLTDRQRETGRNPPDIERLEDLYDVHAFPTLIVAWPGDPAHESTSGYGGREATLAWMAGAVARVKSRDPMARDTLRTQ